MSTHDNERLPRDTTPTWEVELLISGVAVFAMLQLPELLDRVVLDWAPRFIDRWAKLVWLVYIYAKSAALILAVTFVIHLLLRARWIALVGMLSIYPKGVDWDTFRIGPNARDIESARMGRMEDAIDRADNRATMVFAIGVVLASILCAVTVVVATLIGIAWVLEARLAFAIDTNWIAWGGVALVLPYAAAMLVDRHFGAGLAAGGRVERVLRAVLSGYARIGMGMANNPALALLSSHRGRRRTIVGVSAIFTLAVIAASTSYYFARDPDAFGSYAAFPDADALPDRTVDTAHYDDRRDPLRDRRVPYLQSAVVTGPYAQLVVPFDPDRDPAAMQRTCPALATDASFASAPAAQRLACLQRVRSVTLDGRPTALHYDLGHDPRTERPALVAMLDVRALPPGRHVLRVAKAPRPVSNGERTVATGRAEAREDTLLFWR